MKATGFFFIHFGIRAISIMIIGQLPTFLEPTSQNSVIQKFKYSQFVEARVKENNTLKVSHTVGS